jgi:hypothetical protein
MCVFVCVCVCVLCSQLHRRIVAADLELKAQQDSARAQEEGLLRSDARAVEVENALSTQVNQVLLLRDARDRLAQSASRLAGEFSKIEQEREELIDDLNDLLLKQNEWEEEVEKRADELAHITQQLADDAAAARNAEDLSLLRRHPAHPTPLDNPACARDSQAQGDDEDDPHLRAVLLQERLDSLQAQVDALQQARAATGVGERRVSNGGGRQQAAANEDSFPAPFALPSETNSADEASPPAKRAAVAFAPVAEATKNPYKLAADAETDALEKDKKQNNKRGRGKGQPANPRKRVRGASPTTNNNPFPEAGEPGDTQVSNPASLPPTPLKLDKHEAELGEKGKGTSCLSQKEGKEAAQPKANKAREHAHAPRSEPAGLSTLSGVSPAPSNGEQQNSTEQNGNGDVDSDVEAAEGDEAEASNPQKGKKASNKASKNSKKSGKSRKRVRW